MTEPRTEAGRALGKVLDDLPTLDLWELIAEAEKQARAAALDEARARIEGLREHAQRQGTWGIEYGDERFTNDALAAIDALREVKP